MPPFENYDMKGRTYRFMTETPLYPFGYGLSYTDFKYTDGKYDPRTRTFTYRIYNTGERDGDEVAQLYLTNKNDTKGLQKSLVGFERVSIPAGKSVLVSFTIDDEFFQTFVEERQQFEHRGGAFVFRYGDQILEINM